MLKGPAHFDSITHVPFIWAEPGERPARTSDVLGGTLDIAYGPGPRDTLDLFRPKAAKPPVVIFIHGGYWQRLDKSHFSYLARSFVRAGAAVFEDDGSGE